MIRKIALAICGMLGIPAAKAYVVELVVGLTVLIVGGVIIYKIYSVVKHIHPVPIGGAQGTNAVARAYIQDTAGEAYYNDIEAGNPIPLTYTYYDDGTVTITAPSSSSSSSSTASVATRAKAVIKSSINVNYSLTSGDTSLWVGLGDMQPPSPSNYALMGMTPIPTLVNDGSGNYNNYDVWVGIVATLANDDNNYDIIYSTGSCLYFIGTSTSATDTSTGYESTSSMASVGLVINATTNLTPPVVWTPIYTNTTPSIDTMYSYTDTAIDGVPSKFYKLTYVKLPIQP